MHFVRFVPFLLLLLTQTLCAQTPSAVEQEKFVFLNNGTTIGMIVKAVLKADQKNLALTEQQVPKARQVITNATVAYNEGVKLLKKSGMTKQKLRALALTVEADKVHNYKPLLTPEQYTKLVAQHKKIYPEIKL